MFKHVTRFVRRGWELWKEARELWETALILGSPTLLALVPAWMTWHNESLRGLIVFGAVLMWALVFLCMLGYLGHRAEVAERARALQLSQVAAGKISLKAELVRLPTECPPEGYIVTLTLHSASMGGGPPTHSIGLSRRLAVPGGWQWDGNELALRCEVKNYSPETVRGVSLEFDVTFRRVEPLEHGWREGDVVDQYKHQATVDVLRGNCADTFTFYVINYSLFTAAVSPPTQCSLSMLDDAAGIKRAVALMPDTQSIWMSLWPGRAPVPASGASSQ